MPVFFLHVRDGDQLTRDLEGSTLYDLQAARDEAIKSARELMADSIVSEGRIGIDRSIEVSDATGFTLLVIPFRRAVTM
jgi:Domain of unknown function (DUF6894)